jgi:two-component system sensor histidine kinase RpfC
MPAQILVVDDNAELLAVVGRVLRRAGHLVTSTSNGPDALCLLDHRDGINLVLLDLDLRMPNFNGDKVIRDLSPGHPPVVVMTGSGAVKDDFPVGSVERLIAKPFNLSTLLAVVNDVLPADKRGAARPDEVVGGQEFD